jgi:hypothetical protein
MAECGGIEPYAARPLRARVTECHFGFYSSDEIRALSVLNITSTEVRKKKDFDPSVSIPHPFQVTFKFFYSDSIPHSTSLSLLCNTYPHQQQDI